MEAGGENPPARACWRTTNATDCSQFAAKIGAQWKQGAQLVSGILALLCVSIVGFYSFDIWQFALTFWYLAFWYSTILAFCVGIFAFSAFLAFGCHLGRLVGLNAWRWQNSKS